MSSYFSAFQDFYKALLRYPLWVHLSVIEIKQRYHRSVLGPWWISLSMLIFIGVMSIVFSRLFHQSLDYYVPFFSSGFIFWSFISTIIMEAPDVFRGNSHYIKQISLPYNLYIFKHLFKHLLVFCHNLVVYLLICVYFKVMPTLTWFLLIPGFFLLLLNLYWISLLISLIGTRFRDLSPIVASGIQIAFFITPISWMPKLLQDYPKVLKFNPLAYFLDLTRSPLLNEYPATLSWLVCSCMAILGFLLSFFLFGKKRMSLVFWVD